MSAETPPPPSVRTEEERVLRDLEKIHALTRSNRRPTFSTVRDDFPLAAPIFFRGQSLRFVDLRRADLRFIDFRGADLTGAKFEGALILGARFELAKLSRDALRVARDWRDYMDTWRPDASTHDLHFRRRPWERFSFSPHLPELIILPQDLAPQGAGDGLSADEAEHLAAGRLAIAVTCLTESQWRRVVLDDGATRAPDESIAFKPFDATSYCAQLSAKRGAFGLASGGRIKIPSYGLMWRLAQAGLAADGARASADSGDLAPASLAVGSQGREFVDPHRNEATDLGTASMDGLGQFNLHQTSEAHIRPLFLLGEARA